VYKKNNKEAGSALMVSLVLIFMMSLMGVSSMRSATLEKRMSTNSVHKSTVLQAAESATELAIGNQSNLNAALALNGNSSHQATVALGSNSALQLNAEVTYVGMGPPLGDSLGAGGGFVAYRYESRGTAELPDINANATVIQGFYTRAPAPF
jgi:type IV pilus assembly protein PilX